MDEIIKEFLVESNENLDRLDSEFIELEKNTQDKELLSSIFRIIHTIKGTCGFLDFSNLERVSHAGENLLSKLRDGQLQLNSSLVSALLSMIDAIRQMLATIERTGKDGDKDYRDIIDRLNSFTQTEIASEEPVVIPKPKAKTKKTAAAKPEAEEISQSIEVEPENPTPPPVQDSLPIEAETSSTTIASMDSSIRVNVDLLDNLMNLVGELVLSRNEIMQYGQRKGDNEFFSCTQSLSLITSELQEKVMKTRLQPISNIWKKFPRIVRDLSASLNKQVRMEMVGEETEIDKSIIEAIKDPLTHILRNAIDHGIEAPARRKQLGKNEEGTITLRAYHECGQVVMEISDDGAGVNFDAVKQKALKLGWYNASELEQLTPQMLTQLILQPGFSTASEVTAVSGRGVGMDVVKTQVEKIGGILDIQSKTGKGVLLKIRIPLTLSIIPVLIIESEASHYAVPQVNVLELLMINNEEGTQVEWIYDLAVYRLRGKILPLFRLTDIFKNNATNDWKSESKQVLNTIVLQAGTKQFGLIVDKIHDSQDIVVKSLTKLLKSIGIYLGGTILGNGQVSLILDTVGLAERVNLNNNNIEKMVQPEVLDTAGSNAKESFLLMLLANRQLAIPLRWVARLEILSSQSFERAGSHAVIQYRNSLMPVIDIRSELFSEPSTLDLAEHRSFEVVVVHWNGYNLGFVVDEIIDTVLEDIEYHKPFTPGLILSTAIIKGKVTEILDIEHIIHHYFPGWCLDSNNHPEDVMSLPINSAGVQ